MPVFYLKHHPLVLEAPTWTGVVAGQVLWRKSLLSPTIPHLTLPYLIPIPALKVLGMKNEALSQLRRWGDPTCNRQLRPGLQLNTHSGKIDQVSCTHRSQDQSFGALLLRLPAPVMVADAEQCTCSLAASCIKALTLDISACLPSVLVDTIEHRFP